MLQFLTVTHSHTQIHMFEKNLLNLLLLPQTHNNNSVLCVCITAYHHFKLFFQVFSGISCMCTSHTHPAPV